MRLDRVFTYENNRNVKLSVNSMEIVFNEPIYPNSNIEGNRKFMGWFKSIVSFVGDLIGRNWMRKKEEYLFPSDHFGLLTSISIN